jgi:hypothetical protein
LQRVLADVKALAEKVGGLDRLAGLGEMPKKGKE